MSTSTESAKSGSSRNIVFDIETNGFLDAVTTVHCVCTLNVDTGEERAYGPAQINEALRYLESADCLIGHNILRYDIPVLEKLYGFEHSARVHDTKVMARLIWPDMMDLDAKSIEVGKLPPEHRGKHTIEAWGYRLGVAKLHADIDVWTAWTQEMQDRCQSDVRVNAALYRHIVVQDYAWDAFALEHSVDRVTHLMELEGACFDSTAAGELHSKLVGIKEELEKALKGQFGSWLAPDGPNMGVREPKLKRRKLPDGSYESLVGPYTKLKTVEFNPGSRQHIERKMRELGWVPTKHTPSGQAEINEAVIEELVRRFPEAGGLGDLTVVNKRLSQLAEGDSALLRCVAQDGRIHAAYNPMGTQTGRASHFKPNIAQVPAVKSQYGAEFRSLFKVPPGWRLVGADQSSLEGKVLAHYLAKDDGGAYMELLERGDPHWVNTLSLEFFPAGTERGKHDPIHTVCREGAKRFYYAVIYGAQARKCGEIVRDICADADAKGAPGFTARFFPKGTSEHHLKTVGGRARERFINGIEGLKGLTEKAQRMAETKGWVPGLDGRRIPCRSSHSALNYLIQGAGAVICKRWLADTYSEFDAAGMVHGWNGDYSMMAWVHDEIQIGCKGYLADEVGKVMVRNAVEAGAKLGLRVPLASEYTIGRTWLDTH